MPPKNRAVATATIAGVLLLFVVSVFIGGVIWSRRESGNDNIAVPAIERPDLPLYLPSGCVFATDQNKDALYTWVAERADIEKGVDNLPLSASLLLRDGKVQISTQRASLVALAQSRYGIGMLQVEFTGGSLAGRRAWVRMYDVAQDTPGGTLYPYADAILNDQQSVESGHAPR